MRVEKTQRSIKMHLGELVCYYTITLNDLSESEINDVFIWAASLDFVTIEKQFGSFDLFERVTLKLSAQQRTMFLLRFSVAS